MKRIKALSALIVLILCTTIGSVYAAWSYAGTDDIADVFSESKVTITDVELQGANGIFTITSNLVLEIDQRDSDHYAKLVFKSNDGQAIHLTVKFTPAANAPDDIKKNAVSAELYWGVTTPMQYKVDSEGNYDENGEAIDVFKFSNTSDGNLNNIFAWTAMTAEGAEAQEGDAIAYFEYKLDETALKEMIQLTTDARYAHGDVTADTFRLDTKAEHDAFRTTALIGNIVARVTDGTVN